MFIIKARVGLKNKESPSMLVDDPRKIGAGLFSDQVRRREWTLLTATTYIKSTSR